MNHQHFGNLALYTNAVKISSQKLASLSSYSFNYSRIDKEITISVNQNKLCFYINNLIVYMIEVSNEVQDFFFSNYLIITSNKCVYFFKFEVNNKINDVTFDHKLVRTYTHLKKITSCLQQFAMLQIDMDPFLAIYTNL